MGMAIDGFENSDDSVKSYGKGSEPVNGLADTFRSYHKVEDVQDAALGLSFVYDADLGVDVFPQEEMVLAKVYDADSRDFFRCGRFDPNLEEDVEKAGYSEIEIHVGGRDCRDLADFLVGILEERDADDVGTVVEHSLGDSEIRSRSMEF